jgi:hypothetical protein
MLNDIPFQKKITITSFDRLTIDICSKKTDSFIMSTQKLNRENKIWALTLNLIAVLIVGTAFMSCASQKKTTTTTTNNVAVISEVTTNQTSLNKKDDVVNYFLL